jgi:hypothetical protein
MFLEEIDWYGKIATLTTEEVYQSSTYSMPEIKRAVRQLESDAFISLSDLGNPVKKDSKPRLFLTLKGKDAYLDDYYIVENRKDYLQSFELKTKWILPLAGTVIAIISLLISLFNACRLKK